MPFLKSTLFLKEVSSDYSNITPGTMAMDYNMPCAVMPLPRPPPPPPRPPPNGLATNSFAKLRVLILTLVRHLARVLYYSRRMPLDTIRSDLIVFLFYFTCRCFRYIYIRQMDWFLIVCFLDEAFFPHSLRIYYYRWCGCSCFPCSQWSSNSLGLQFLLDVSVLIVLITKIFILIRIIATMLMVASLPLPSQAFQPTLQ